MTEETAFKKRPKRLGLHEKRLKEALELYYEEAEEFFADTAENLQKQILELQKGIPTPPEKCHICGAKLSVHGMSAGERTYYCSKANYFSKNPDESKHFGDSRVIYRYSSYAKGKIEAYEKLLEALK